MKKTTRFKGRNLTAELVACVERFEPDPGPEPGTTEHTKAEFDAMVEALLREYKPEDLWIFAYGSLIWNPEFEFVESHRATAYGWHRSFCLKLTRWRGTRELPALMLALDRGGSCNGLAYRLPAQDHFKQLGLLMFREIDANPPTNVPRWISVKTETGILRALAFVAARDGMAYAGKLPMEKVAHVFHAEHEVSRLTKVVAIELVVPRHVVGLVKQVIGIECQTDLGGELVPEAGVPYGVALLVPGLRGATSLGAAGVAGLLAVLAVKLPYNLGLVTASIGGVIAGLLIESIRESPLSSAPTNDVERWAFKLIRS